MPRHLIAAFGLLAEQATRVPQPIAEEGDWRVVLFNDQVHTFAEVITVLAAATGFDVERCSEITLEVHTAGRAMVTRTDAGQAEKMVRTLTRGGLLAAVRLA